MNSVSNYLIFNTKINDKTFSDFQTRSNSAKMHKENSNVLTNYLVWSKVINMNKVSFSNDKYGGYELAIDEHTLDKIIEAKTRKIDLNPNAEYEKLADGDKKALKHLVKSAQILNDVFLEQDNSANIKVRDALVAAANSGDSHARKTLTIFNIFNGVEGNDGFSTEPMRLIKGLERKSAGNVFPEDLDDKNPKELIDFLKSNPVLIPQFLSNDTIVKRTDKGFEAIPYRTAFKEQYAQASKELLEAAKTSTNRDFSEYLRLQANALISDDPEYTYKADALWANLKDTPLEFTIGRESYEDGLTGIIASDPDLKKIIGENKIAVKSKDFIGARVGIVNKEGTEFLNDYKNHLKNLSQLMPLKDLYKQSTELKNDTDEVKQGVSDVDLVYLSGDYSSCRPGITIAQNLPNDDKISTILKAGRKNVFHRQIRKSQDPEARKRKLEALVEESQRQLYDPEADHYFTIGHELTHSLGPMKTLKGAETKTSLGMYGDIIEEAKADLGSIVGTEYFEKVGKYTHDDVEKIYLTWAVDQLPLSNPDLNQAHRVREVMQLNYFIENGAINFKDGGKLSINKEKMNPVARQMLEEVIKIQLDGDANKAKEFVDKYRQWNETLEYASKVQKELKPRTLRILDMSLAQGLS